MHVCYVLPGRGGKKERRAGYVFEVWCAAGAIGNQDSL